MTPSIFDIWCKLCALAASLLMLCQGLNIVRTNMSLISVNNVTIKGKIDNLVGDPDGECPACPPPGEELVAQQGVTQALVEQTETIKAATVAIKATTAAVRTKLGIASEGKVATKKETTETANPVAEREAAATSPLRS